MDHINALRERLLPEAKDLKLNLQTVLNNERLTPDQAWGCVLTSAIFLKDEELARAVAADAAAAGVPETVLEDARASAGIMAMNSTYYRFRHMVEGDKYGQMPPKLRMNRMMQLSSDKGTFELMSMCCAVLAGCEMCINAHAASITKHGMTEEHVHESARIAAAVSGFSTALFMANQAAAATA